MCADIVKRSLSNNISWEFSKVMEKWGKGGHLSSFCWDLCSQPTLAVCPQN